MRSYEFAKIAYDAYCKQTGGKSLATGDTLPDFWSLRQEIRDAWWAATEAVRHASGIGQLAEQSSSTDAPSPHSHVAKYVGDKLTDECAQCGLDLRNPVHFRDSKRT